MSGDLARELIDAANGLSKVEGIYVSSIQRELSYPNEGNDRSLELEESSFWFRHRNDCIRETVRRFAPRVPVVFDIGGGNGFVSMGLIKAGITPVVVEPMKSGAMNARDRGIENVVCSSLEDAGFSEQALPAVGMFDVLEHIEDDLAFLSSVRSYLQKGGMIYLTVPSYQCLWSRIDQIGGHFRRYRIPGLKRILRESGFDVCYASYIFWFLPMPLFIARVVPERLGLRRKGNEVSRSEMEHGGGGGLLARLVTCLCRVELAWLKRGLFIPFGGSCLVAARRL